MAAKNAVLEAVVLLRSLANILDAQILDAPTRREVEVLEKKYAESAIVPVVNRGIDKVLGRQHACVLIKTAAFRPPPMPSVYMVEEMPPADEPSGAESPESGNPSHMLTAGDGRYHIIGEELIGSPPVRGEEILWISQSFIMFPGRRIDAGKPALFLLPPIPFPELEERSGELGIDNVVSGSPCSLSDDYLRRVYGFNTDRSLGSLLIGFDTR